MGGGRRKTVDEVLNQHILKKSKAQAEHNTPDGILRDLYLAAASIDEAKDRALAYGKVSPGCLDLIAQALVITREAIVRVKEETTGSPPPGFRTTPADLADMKEVDF